MRRLTVEKDTEDMTMTELAHNCMYAKDRQAWYRDNYIKMDLRNFIRYLSKEIGGNSLPENNEDLEEELYENLQYALSDKEGLIAFIYRLMWSMTDLRETLKSYEDTGLTSEEIKEHQQIKQLKKEDLEKYRGEPVWIILLHDGKKLPRGWCVVNTIVNLIEIPGEENYLSFKQLGKTYLAYNKKPKTTKQKRAADVR